MFKLITSWDDGDVLDLKLARLLDRYGVRGTFYIPKEYSGSRLSNEQIKNLAEHHEIGAHTLTHQDLRKLSLEDKRKEILGSKEWLQGLLGKEISTFCYPFGFYDKETLQVVKECGFKNARTTQVELSGDVFEMPVSLQVYPFPFRKNNAKAYNWRSLLKPFFERVAGLRCLGVPYTSMTSWGGVARALLEKAKRDGRDFHLWGHSWEIEKYGMWGELENFLKYASSLQK